MIQHIYNILNNVQNLSILLVLAPLINSIFLGLFGNHVKKTLINYVSIFSIAITTVITLYFLWHVCIIKDLKNINNIWYVWGNFVTIQFKFGFLLDELNVIMLFMVASISLIIYIYSTIYMQKDPSYSRYFSYISFFTFAMYLLIIANNFLQLFVGWELVGLASYLLIGFWFKQRSANRAALKAFLINRVGDIGLLIGISIIFGICNDLDYIKIFNLLPKSDETSQFINIISIALFIGIITKSAQIPLHIWLPDSMEAPTPVSALIHAATMVAAGVFLLARMSPIFEYSEYCLNLVLFIGSITAFFMGIIAVVENDIKRIFAYSTISQLGIMMAAMGVSAYAAGIFHLITHSFVKALLFLGAGAIMLTIDHIQNIHDMPKLKILLPVTYWCMLIASLSMSGIPGFSGFFSKHLIIESVVLSDLSFAKAGSYLLNCSMWITPIYIFRVMFIVFHQQPTGHHKLIFSESHKQFSIINGCLIALTIFSLVIGWFLIKPLLNNSLFGDSIFVLPQHNVLKNYLEHDFQNITMMLWQGLISTSGLSAIFGVICAVVFYFKKPHLSSIIKQIMQNDFKGVYNLLQKKYFFNELNKVMIIIGQFTAKFFAEIVDVLLIDCLIINNISKTLMVFSKYIQKIQTGYLYHYLILMLTGVLIIVLWLFLNIY